jgi:hypothetical protein
MRWESWEKPENYRKLWNCGKEQRIMEETGASGEIIGNYEKDKRAVGETGELWDTELWGKQKITEATAAS